MLTKINKFANSNPWIGVLLCIIMMNMSCMKDPIEPTSIPKGKDEFINPSKLESATKIALKKSNPDFDAETLFRGIMFAEGDVADRIPEIKGLDVRNLLLDSVSLNEALVFQNHIVSEIKTRFPTFLTEFKTAMQSGNHLKIDNMIKQTHIVYEQIINEIINNMEALFQAHLSIPTDAQLLVMANDFVEELGPKPQNKGLQIRDLLLNRRGEAEVAVATERFVAIDEVFAVATDLVVAAEGWAVVIVAVAAILVAVICHDGGSLPLSLESLHGAGLYHEMFINSIAINLKAN